MLVHRYNWRLFAWMTEIPYHYRGTYLLAIEQAV